MGLFDKVKVAKQQATDAMQGGMPGAGAPGMGGQDMAAMAAYSQKVNKIATAGIEAPGVIHSIRATGTPDIAGATLTDFDVTIRPDGGEPYQATIEQSMLPMQMEGISEGIAIVVKYDPDNPTAAILHSW